MILGLLDNSILIFFRLLIAAALICSIIGLGRIERYRITAENRTSTLEMRVSALEARLVPPLPITLPTEISPADKIELGEPITLTPTPTYRTPELATEAERISGGKLK